MVDEPREAWQLRLTFGETARSGDVVVRLTGATVDVGEHSVVVTRDDDGVVHAMLNVCRHRGAPVAAGTDLANLGMVLSVDGRPVETGSSAAILGHPLRALVAAARMVAAAGETLAPGDIVLAGAATAAVPLAPGQSVSLRVQSMGSVAVNVEE